MPVSKGPPFIVTSPSRSRPGVVYQTIVSELDGHTCVCNCPAFWRSWTCAHELTARSWYSVHHPEKEKEMTQALVTQEVRSLAPVYSSRPPKAVIPTAQETFDMIHLANALTKAAGFAIPKHYTDPRKTYATIYRGWELGVRPMVALNHMFVVSGKVETDAQLMMGIVMARDHTARFTFKQHDQAGCVVELSRERPSVTGIYLSPQVTVGKWTREDATLSGQLTVQRRPKVERWKEVNGRNTPVYARDEQGAVALEDVPNRWVTNWMDMVAWAAVKRACRLGAPDLINGIEGAGGIAEDQPFAVEEADAPVQLPVKVDAPEFEAPGEALADESPAAVDGEIVGEYPWFKQMKAAQDELGIKPDDWNLVVGQGDNDMDELLGRIDNWIFQIEVSDMDARVKQLVKAVADARAKRQEQAPLPLRGAKP